MIKPYLLSEDICFQRCFIVDDEMMITFETLFDLVQREKKREELQKLDSSFYASFVDYFRSKRQLLKSKKQDFASPEEIKRIELQLENIQKLMRELYDKREKKIVMLAISKARTASAIVDSSKMLPEEKKLFDAIVKALSLYRCSVLDSLLAAKMPRLVMAGQNNTNEESKKPQTKLIRLLGDVPKFVGKNLEIYGPFSKDEIASLPVEIAEVLISKGKAEEISKS